MSLEQEPLETFTELAKLVHKNNGRKVHVKSMYRWAGPSVGGVRLKSVRVGGRVLSSHAALTRFFARLTDSAAKENAPTTSSAKSAAASAATDAAKRAGDLLDAVVFRNRT